MKLNEFLNCELSYRKSRNSRYSGRAFGRDMGTSSSFTTQLLNGEAKLSETRALEIANRLQLADNKKQLLLNIVKLSHTFDPQLCEKISLEIEIEKTNMLTIEQVTEAQFRTIAKWYTGATFSLLTQLNGHINGKIISQTFSVKEEEAEELLSDLITVGLLRYEDDRYVRSSPWYKIQDIPSIYIKKYHAAHLEKAKNAIFNQKHHERDITGSTLSFHSKYMDEVKNIIKEFRDKIARVSLSTEEHDSIYHLAVQFYRLDEQKKEFIQ